jgi:hypothetical protein
MGYTAHDSLKHEYASYVEREIEEYKDRVPRAALLSIANEAVQHLCAQEQVTLNEIVLCVEVDRIISARLRLPVYRTWVRRRQKELEALRRPERWGLTASTPIVRNIPTSGQAHVLVAQSSHEFAPLFLAANGCTVTALETHSDIVARILKEADASGLSGRVALLNTGLDAFAPTEPLAAVVYTQAAFADLTAEERARVLRVLQHATTDGGVHLVETIVAGSAQLDLEELRASYAGWEVSLEGDGNRPERTFVARKS